MTEILLTVIIILLIINIVIALTKNKRLQTERLEGLLREEMKENRDELGRNIREHRFPAGPEPESRQLWPRRHGVDPHGPYDLGRQGARRVAFVQGDSGGDVDLLVGVLRRIYRFPDLRDL